MQIAKLKNELRRRRELNDWLKQQRKNRIDPRPFSDALQRDLNIGSPAYEESKPQPPKHKEPKRKPAGPVFAMQGGFA